MDSKKEKNSLKDNPVPSIDNLAQEFHDKHMKLRNEPIAWRTLQDFTKFLKTKLQNGVETDKEYPDW